MSGGENRFGDLGGDGDRGRPRDDVAIFCVFAPETHRGVNGKQYSFGLGIGTEFAFDSTIRYREKERSVASDDQHLCEPRGFRGIRDAREAVRETIIKRGFKPTFVDLPATGEFAIRSAFEKFLESRLLDRRPLSRDGRIDSHGSDRGFKSAEKLSRIEMQVRFHFQIED
jgi:hypothetical protein